MSSNNMVLGFGRTSGGDNLPIYVSGWGEPSVDANVSAGEPYAIAIRAAGAAAYWAVDEQVGSTALNELDDAGTYDGTLSGTYTQGLSGPFPLAQQDSIKFAGAQCATAFPIPAHVSVECWVYQEGNGTGAHPALITDTLQTNFPFELTLSDAGLLSYKLTFAALAPGFVSTGLTLALNTWHYVVATWDGTTYNVYVDGVLGYTTATYSGQVLKSGHLQWGLTAGSVNARIAQVAIYTSAIDQDTVTAHYALRNAALNRAVRPMQLCYGRTAGGVNLPLLVDADGKLNIVW
jgi:hypothetical protein